MKYYIHISTDRFGQVNASEYNDLEWALQSLAASIHNGTFTDQYQHTILFDNGKIYFDDFSREIAVLVRQEHETDVEEAMRPSLSEQVKTASAQIIHINQVRGV